jgi:hypothetical protein
VIDKKYYALDELAAQFSCHVLDLVHLGATAKLPLYALADGWWMELWHLETYELDPHGGPERKLIRERSKKASPQSITGPVRLYPASLARLEANPAARESEFMASGPPDDHTDFDDDEKVIEDLGYEYRRVMKLDGEQQDGVPLANCRLVVMDDDLQLVHKLLANKTVMSQTKEKRLLREIALLSVLLSEKANNLKIDNKPNVSQIAESAKETLDKLAAQSVYKNVLVSGGLSLTNLKDSISEGLKLLFGKI